MLSDFSWDMTGYIPKHAVNPHGDGIIPYAAERIFQLEPEPPAVGNLNEYILSALHEKDLIYFSFFLHYYEPQLNKRIKGFLGVDGGDLYDTDRFLDIKLSCREQMLQKLMDYDPAKGAEYALSLIHIFKSKVRSQLLRCFITAQIEQPCHKVDYVPLGSAAEAEKIVLIQLQARMPVVVERAASHAVVAHFQPVVFGGLLDADCRLDGFIDCHRKPSVHNILESTKHPP